MPGSSQLSCRKRNRRSREASSRGATVVQSEAKIGMSQWLTYPAFAPDALTVVTPGPLFAVEWK